MLSGLNRKTRFHDEKGNCVDLGGLPYALPAFFGAAAKRLLGRRPQVPMISYRARRVIEGLLTPDTQMIEFGSGNSTPWFAARVSRLISIEDQESWYQHVQGILAANNFTNVRHERRPEAAYADLSDIEDGSIDFVLVDGLDRDGCIRSAVPKIKPGGWLYLDNSDKDMTLPDGDMRQAEAALLDAVNNRNGSIRYFTDFSPTNFFAEQGALARL